MASFDAKARLAGVTVDLAVPLDADGAIISRDYVVQVQRMSRLHTVAGVVVNGTGCRADRFDLDERLRLVDLTSRAAPRGFPWFAGIGPAEADGVEREVKTAGEAGAAGLLVATGDVPLVAPLAAQVSLPLLVSAESDGTDLAGTLQDVPGVAGVVVPAPSADDVARLVGAMPAGVVLVGDPAASPGAFGAGAAGTLQLQANIVPERWGRFVADALAAAGSGEPVDVPADLRALAEALGSWGAERRLSAVKAALKLQAIFDQDLVRSAAPAPSEAERSALRELLVSANVLAAG